MGRNHEVTEFQDLLDGNGEIREPGWSRRMVQRYKRRMIKAPAFRIKEWDYYIVLGDGFGATFTISDDGYVGLQSVTMLLTGEICTDHTETILNVLPLGRLHLPEDPQAGSVKYADKRLKMRFDVYEGYRRIRCRFKEFKDGKDFSCDIKLRQPDMDRMVIATPWDEKHAFYYNQKINCMRASGWMEFDGKRYEFDPSKNFGTLDWGRGVWTYDNTWYWGSGNADINGKAFGFNIGYGFGNTSAASEIVIFYDGKAHKIDDVEFHIPESSYLDKWTITSSDGRFEMEFTPMFDRAACLDFKVIMSDQHQVFGKMNGKAVLDDGTVIDVSDLFCFAEKVHNKY